MSVIQPGQLLDESLRCQEQPKYSLKNVGHCLVIVKTNISTRDITQITDGVIHLAVYENGPVLFLLYKLGESDWEEVPFSWHTQNDAQKVYLDEKIIAPFEYSFRLVLAEPSGAVAAAREFTLSGSFAGKLHDIILRQSRSMFNAQSFGKHLNSVYNQVDVSEMVSLAEACFKSL